MSVDLLIEPVRPISMKPLLPRIAEVLAELLNVTTVPALVMDRREEGQRLPVESDEVGVDDAPFLLISISGEPETIGLVGSSDHLTVTISGARSSLLYALGAATAITLARELGAGVWDDRRFFGDEVHTSPEALLRRLKVTGHYEDYRAAAERINWGPAGPRDENDSEQR